MCFIYNEIALFCIKINTVMVGWEVLHYHPIITCELMMAVINLMLVTLNEIGRIILGGFCIKVKQFLISLL